MRFSEKEVCYGEKVVNEKSMEAVTITSWANRVGQLCSTGWFRAAIGLGLLGFVLAAVDVRSAVQLLKTADYVYLGLALIFFSANKVAMACRWNVLTKVKGMTLSVGQSLKISLISNFVGSILPSGLGSDVYRIYQTSRTEKRTDEVAASVIMERSIGMLTRSAVAVLGVILILNSHHQTSFGLNLAALILGFCALSSLVFWLSIHNGTVELLTRLVDWWGDHWILRQGLKLQQAYVDYKRNSRSLLWVFVLSLTGVFLVSVGNYYAARALDISVGIVFYFGVISIITLISRIPVSVAGLGIVEGSYVLLFSILGVSTTEAFTLALLVRLTECVFAIAGGMLYLIGGDTKNTEE